MHPDRHKLEAKRPQLPLRLEPTPMRLTLCSLLLALLVLAPLLPARSSGSEVEYIGGTIADLGEGSKGRLLTTHPEFLFFETRKGLMRIPFSRINLLEYGQKASRRYGLAIVISPLLLMSKSRQHFLSLGYADEDNRQQALVFRVDKDSIRALLVSLEARTGMKVEFQDDEARKAGKG
jgi:hypothetical protein